MTNKVTTERIDVLNDTERRAIKAALEHYIATHPDKQSWSQKVILEEMLDKLMWAH